MRGEDQPKKKKEKKPQLFSNNFSEGDAFVLGLFTSSSQHPTAPEELDLIWESPLVYNQSSVGQVVVIPAKIPLKVFNIL